MLARVWIGGYFVLCAEFEQSDVRKVVYSPNNTCFHVSKPPSLAATSGWFIRFSAWHDSTKTVQNTTDVPCGVYFWLPHMATPVS